jgi:hypothetical protein
MPNKEVCGEPLSSARDGNGNDVSVICKKK